MFDNQMKREQFLCFVGIISTILLPGNDSLINMESHSNSTGKATTALLSVVTIFSPAYENSSQTSPSLANIPESTKGHGGTSSPADLLGTTSSNEFSVRTGLSEHQPGDFRVDISLCRNNSCGNITASSGSVTVFMSSSGMSGPVNCWWQIVVPAGKYIYVAFDDFRLGHTFPCLNGVQEVVKVTEPRYNTNLIEWCDRNLGLPSPAASVSNELIFSYYHSHQTITDAPGIKFWFKATDQSWRKSLPVVFTTNESGYVESPGYDGRRTYPHYVDATTQLSLPSGYVIMISFLRFDVEDHRDCIYDYLTLSQVEHNDTKELWKLCGTRDIETKVYDKPLRFSFRSDTFYGLTGFRMLFSLHPVSQTPQEVDGGMFNCSVPFYSRFERHLNCNLVQECMGNEDEMNCPYTTEQCGPELLDVGTKCLSYRNLKKEITWNEAHSTCMSENKTLMTIKTQHEWSALESLLAYSKNSSILFVGLSTAQSSLSDMYKDVLQWSDRTMAYYVRGNALEIRVPSCFYLPGGYRQKLFFMSCNKKVSGYFLCERDKDTIKQKQRIEFHGNVTDTYQTRVTLTKCPGDHMTHDYLSCDMESRCGLEVFYASCAIEGTELSIPMYFCDDMTQTIPYSLVCDHRSDCADGSDERFCKFAECTGFQCQNLQCIELSQHCDNMQHCVDGSDEECTKIIQQVMSSLPPPAIVQLNGRGSYTVTAMNSTDLCPDTHFRCPDNGYCLPVYLRCNGVDDCPGREDETNCSSYTCPGFYHCRASSMCLHPTHVCDGVFQCPQHDDERLCHVECPADSCSCQGLAFICVKPFNVTNHADLRYVDASGTSMVPDNFSGLFYLSSLTLARCGLRSFSNMSLSNLKILDLSYNLLSALDMSDFVELPNLRELRLTGNPLVSITKITTSWSLPRFKSINLSGTKIQVYDGAVFACCSRLQVLNLSDSELNTISESSFAATPSLTDLDLRGSPLDTFPYDMLKKLSSLKYVYADNFKVCCRATLPDNFIERNCFTSKDELSSCEDLLQSHWYRAFLWIFAMLAVVGNGGSFAVRIFLQNQAANQASYNVFVSNLCFADLLMGIYLTIIGSADHMYRGVYLWYDKEWKTSLTCKVAGFLSLLSCEVSAFMICLITLDRFLVLRFPFSRIRFQSGSAAIACTIAWILGAILATIPLLPMTSHWEFYSQTGICIPLPIIRKSFKGQDYSFGVVIVLNFVLFLLIAVGQVIIYISVRANSISAARKKTSRDLVIARRLMTIVLSDFLCWFPIGLLGLLAARGTPIPGEVSVAVAIFVLPFNSALNPFLYTFNILMEKRRKAVESRLMERLEARLTTEIVSRRDMALNKVSAPVSRQAAQDQIMMSLDTDLVSPDTIGNLIREQQGQQERDVDRTSAKSQSSRKEDAMEMLRAWLHSQLLTSGEVVSLAMDCRTQIP